MSVQLILYPQSYNGQYNAISNVADEKIVDGVNFSTINTSASVDVASSTPSAAITAAPPNIINTWYRSRSTSSGTPSLPDASGGDLYLYSVVGITSSGVYQRLSNLTIGQSYNFIVKLDNTASGQMYMAAYNGTSGSIITQASPIITTLVGNAYFINFTAQTTQDIIQVNYNNSVVDTFTIKGISFIPIGQTTTFTNFHLEDGQVICDLYQEEDIPLTLSVDDFKNVAEKIQSYSKDFNLPATKRNNQIFNHIFEITRSDDGIIFNPYVKTQCVLKQDGFVLFEGYLRLIDVQDQEGEISYNVNLYSEVVALADVLKDRTFSDLDFTELEHDYQKDNIKYSWNDAGSIPNTGITYLNANTSGYRDANNTLKYPFVNWTGQMLISDGTNGIAHYPELSSLEQVFRPFINIKYIIDRIFEATPFTWTSTFFDTQDFQKLFMDFNWGEGLAPNDFDVNGESIAKSSDADNFAPSGTYGDVLFPHDNPSGVNPWSSESGFDSATSKFTSTQDNVVYNISYDIHLEWTGSTTVTIEWFSTTDGVMNQQTQAGVSSDTWIYSGNILTTLNTGGVLFCRFRATSTPNVKQNNTVAFGSHVYGNVSADVITNANLLDNLRGELGQWDFLKGLITMFNLISMPDKNNPLNINFEPYADVFISDTAGTTLTDRSIKYDWTDKVDVAEMKLVPLTDLNKKTIFKFVEDDDDYAFNVYKEAVSGFLYGSKKFDASGLTILEGEDEIIAEPFAATIPKPLDLQFSDFVVPAIYSMGSDGIASGFDNSPRIMYNIGTKTLNAGLTYFIPAQNGLGSENQPQFLQFSHLTTTPTIVSSPPLPTDTQDYHFGECQLIDSSMGSPVPDNLFNLYWLPYYAELYNPNTRIMTIKVNLTPSDINRFSFADRVMIKNRVFRVNKIDYKPNDLATVEFILIP